MQIMSAALRRLSRACEELGAVGSSGWKRRRKKQLERTRPTDLWEVDGVVLLSREKAGN
jgi:hypothetical protein